MLVCLDLRFGIWFRRFGVLGYFVAFAFGLLCLGLCRPETLVGFDFVISGAGVVFWFWCIGCLFSALIFGCWIWVFEVF